MRQPNKSPYRGIHEEDVRYLKECRDKEITENIIVIGIAIMIVLALCAPIWNNLIR